MSHHQTRHFRAVAVVPERLDQLRASWVGDMTMVELSEECLDTGRQAQVPTGCGAEREEVGVHSGAWGGGGSWWVSHHFDPVYLMPKLQFPSRGRT